jgi:hypothetical protein
MPTVTAQRAVTVGEVEKALQEALGTGFEITTRGSGDKEAVKVKQSTAATATVHLDHEGTTTTFHIHGGGLVISRMINEFGIAKKVAKTIESAFAGPPSGDQPGPPPEES